MPTTSFNAGNPEMPLRLTGEVLETLRTLNSSPAMPGLAATLTNMATYLVALGRYEEARVHANEALDLARGLRLVALVSLSLRLLALVGVLKPQADGRLTSGDYAGGARLFGFLDAHLSTVAPEKYGLRQEYDHARTALRRALGADDLAHMMAAGAPMTEDEAIDQANAIQ